MTSRPLPTLLAAALIGSIAAEASAATEPTAIPAVVTRAIPTPRLATLFELKLRLPQGRGLARLLLDAGIASHDTAEAAKLAPGKCDPIRGIAAQVPLSPAPRAGLMGAPLL